MASSRPFRFPDILRATMVKYVREAGARYWSMEAAPQDLLEKPEHVALDVLGRAWVSVTLPGCFAAIGVDGALWVDAAAVRSGDGDPFTRCDWYVAAFSYLAGVAEYRHECMGEVVHSFAWRLPEIPARCYEHAWVNRIFLLMRAMEAQSRGMDADTLFGALPEAEILLTHDIDALDKTWAIRLKQTAFEAFNTLRALSRGQFRKAVQTLVSCWRMFFHTPSYDYIAAIAQMATQNGLRSRFHVYVRAPRRKPHLWLMDPAYAVADPRLKDLVKGFCSSGMEFGLHPSYDAWADVAALREACEAMENALGVRPVCVRQHWLRFSWKKTWAAQADAGLVEDTTLGFNDRTGFRVGAALRYHPWDFDKGAPHRILALPMMAMDSHFYAYNPMDTATRRQAMAALFAEVRAVHGVVSVLWHPHTLAADYGWQEGFQDLLACMKK